MIWLGVLLYIVGLVVVAISLAAPKLDLRQKGLLSSGAAKQTKKRQTYLERVRWMMWQAGWDISPSSFVTTQAVGMGLFFIGGMIAGGLGGGLLGAATAFVVPYTILDMRRSQKVNEYNAAFPTVLSVLLEHLRHQGANLPAALQATAEMASEAARNDLLEIAAAFSAGKVDLTRLQRLVTRRSSPFLQRLVTVLVARKDNLNALLDDLTIMLVETQQDAALLTQIKSALQMPTLTLAVIGLGAPAMFVMLLFMFPSLRIFYVLTVTGNVMGGGAMAIMLGTTAWAYANLQRQAQLLEPQFLVPESRGESAFYNDDALAGQGGEA